jgi:hypothetical protein
MVFKDGTAYLQAGGGIVFDSVEEDEYIETLNKLGGNVRALQQAEGMIYNIECIIAPSDLMLSAEHWYAIQQNQTREQTA